MKFGTKVIHAGIKPDPSTRAIMTPIFQTSTYVQKAPGDHLGYQYSRTQNPTRQALQNNLAALEGAKYGVCFSSGLAAMDAVIKLLRSGDEVISTNDLYGGSYRLLTKIYDQFGIDSKFINLADANNLKNHISSKTKLIWIETPTNPILNIVDIEAICKIAHAHNLIVCVDNTFASPYLQQPIELGADIILHSATKYLGGHSDVIQGALVTNSKELADRLYFIQNSTGAVPGPQDCFLVLRGIKTLHIRMDRACSNAQKIVTFLDAHSKVSKVFYPGLSSHKNHEIAKKQMKNYGGMISFDLHKSDVESGLKVLRNTHLFSLAESLGGVESLIGHPSTMTHAAIPRDERLKTGLSDSLIRLSVGIEDVDDLIQDLDFALSKV